MASLLEKQTVKIGRTAETLTKVAAPSEWTPSIEDLVKNSTRVGNGRMRANFIANKRTWAAKWTNLTEVQSKQILDIIEGVFEFKIQCYDPASQTVLTKDFYKGTREFEKLVHLKNGTYSSISVTFIEC